VEMELDILCVVGGIILCVIVVVGHGSHAIFYDLHKFLVLFQDHLQNLRVCGGWLCVGSGFFYRGRCPITFFLVICKGFFTVKKSSAIAFEFRFLRREFNVALCSAVSHIRIIAICSIFTRHTLVFEFTNISVTCGSFMRF